MAESDDQLVSVGAELVAELEQFAALDPATTVLDVGCGYGRLAAGLLRAGFRGSYVGFDVLAKQVEWCQTELAPLADGRMHFEHLDVANERYRPDDGSPAAE